MKATAEMRRTLTPEQVERLRLLKRRIDAARWLGLDHEDPFVARLLFLAWRHRTGRLGAG